MKRGLATILALALIAATLGGCAKVTGGNTPLKEEYNAVMNARRDIKGFDKNCIYYNSNMDRLIFYACPGVDYEAVIRIAANTVAGRPVNMVTVSNSASGGDMVYCEPILEPFSRLFTMDIACLELDDPEIEAGSVKLPQLWRECLARMDNVTDLMLMYRYAKTSGATYSYWRDISGGTVKFPQYKTVTVQLNVGNIDLSGTEVFSGVERLRLYSHTAVSPGGLDVDALKSIDSLQCTRIVIAHRLSTIRHCDRIIALEGGKIIEDGSYDELIAKDGYFADLVSRQRLEVDKFVGTTTLY